MALPRLSKTVSHAADESIGGLGLLQSSRKHRKPACFLVRSLSFLQELRKLGGQIEEQEEEEEEEEEDDEEEQVLGTCGELFAVYVMAFQL